MRVHGESEHEEHGEDEQGSHEHAGNDHGEYDDRGGNDHGDRGHGGNDRGDPERAEQELGADGHPSAPQSPAVEEAFGTDPVARASVTLGGRGDHVAGADGG